MKLHCNVAWAAMMLCLVLLGANLAAAVQSMGENEAGGFQDEVGDFGSESPSDSSIGGANLATSSSNSGRKSGNEMGIFSQGFGGLLGGRKEAPRAAAAAAAATTSNVGKEKEVAAKEGKKDIFVFLGELSKLIFKPVEFVKHISEYFKIPFDKFVEKLGAGLIFGIEAVLQPALVSIKVVEKIFVPDTCRLKFVCRLGSNLGFLKETILKFSPHFLEGSSHIKAFSDGIIGRDCETTFKACEPKLKKAFENLRGKEPEAAASSRSEARESRA